MSGRPPAGRRAAQPGPILPSRFRRRQRTDSAAARAPSPAAHRQALADLQRFVAKLADALPALVAYVDAQGICRFANRAFGYFHGRGSVMVVGRPMSDTLGTGKWPVAAPHVAAVLAGQPRTFQNSLEIPGQGIRHVQISFVPDVQDGQVRGFFALVTDITELKQTGLDLARANGALDERAKQAEAATRAKSVFLANMSHEIRTPMNAILGLTHLMTRESRDALQRDRLTKVDSAAKHLLQIINDILDLSKVESGKLTLEQIEFSVDELLASCFELVGERAQSQGVELIADLQGLPARLCGDPTRLRQALVNLLSNAVKFTTTGWVRLRVELLGEDRSRQHLRFEVQDTGEGIAPEEQIRVFHAFEQADVSTTRRHGGTGLGLALTRHLVQLMGGEIGLQSAPGQGSTFWFTAWLGRAAQAGNRAAPLPVQGLRVLVVDDLPEASLSLGRQLALMGLQVQSASSGAQALQVVAEAMRAARPFDLLMIDWHMVPMDGVQTLDGLRRLLHSGMPPAVLVSAFDEPAMWQQARAARFDGVLVKPVTPSALHDSLMRVLRHGTALPPLPAPSPGQAEALLRQRHAGQRVLLAEDNPVNQDVACELLSLAGLVVEVADNGQSAVTLAASRPYDLVLMDMQMPVMDGLAATRALRQRLGDGLPVVAMTANAFGDDRAACLAAGMNDHIPKPVNPESLYLTLLRWLPESAARHGRTDRNPVLVEPPARPPLAERLDGLSGLDLGVALQIANQQWPLLARILGSFSASYRDGAVALMLAVQAGDQPAAAAACHSMAGACAAVGAGKLAAQAFALQALLQQPGAAGRWHAPAVQLDDDLRQLAQALAAAL